MGLDLLLWGDARRLLVGVGSRLVLRFVVIGGLSRGLTLSSREIGVLLFLFLNLTVNVLFMRLEAKTFQVLIYAQPKNSMSTEIDGL